MEAIRQWAAALCVSCIAAGLLRMLVPEGGSTKVLNLVLSVYIILSVLSARESVDLTQLRRELSQMQPMPAADWQGMVEAAVEQSLAQRLRAELEQSGLSAQVRVDAGYRDATLSELEVHLIGSAQEREAAVEIAERLMGVGTVMWEEGEQ